MYHNYLIHLVKEAFLITYPNLPSFFIPKQALFAKYSLSHWALPLLKLWGAFDSDRRYKTFRGSSEPRIELGIEAGAWDSYCTQKP